MNWAKSLIADPENRHSDEMALLSILGVLTYIGLAVYAVVVKGQAFDWQGYGMGLGAAIGAAAAGMGLKCKLEGGMNVRPESEQR